MTSYKKGEYARPVKHKRIRDFLKRKRSFTVFEFRTAIYGGEWTGWGGHARNAIEVYCEKILRGLEERGLIAHHKKASKWSTKAVPSERDLQRIEEKS